MTDTTFHSDDPHDEIAPPADELDALLRDWHEVNRRRAVAGRDRLLAQLADSTLVQTVAPRPRTDERPTPMLAPRRRFTAPRRIRSFVSGVYARAAVALAAVAVLVTLIMPSPHSSASACDRIIQVAEGGRLDAVAPDGRLIGPCPLEHTDVDVKISGHFTRVNVRQKYSNPYSSKVEAVYTFPLSHRGAVDRMTMTVRSRDGEERVVVGEVKERNEARQIYENAKASGYVASLLEQERPDIFTQSVANIEPGSTVTVEIGYVETLQSVDGEYHFDFPMVVAPRYIPGYPVATRGGLPAGLRAIQGIILLGPASFEVAGGSTITAAQVGSEIGASTSIDVPQQSWWAQRDVAGPQQLAGFVVRYANGSAESGQLFKDGTGHVNGRWFYTDRAGMNAGGTGSARDTNLVPDASRITPMPVRPPLRAGHDVSLTVAIDPGSEKIIDLKSVNHQIADSPAPGAQSSRAIALRNTREIPNRDFVLSWRTSAETIAESVFAYTKPASPVAGIVGGPAIKNGESQPAAIATTDGYFTVVINPPARVVEAEVRPRELIFVLDTSGSMAGFPIEKSKDVVARALAAVRPGDTFNIITFAGDTNILWSSPRPASPENLNEARGFIASRAGGGGTEMMKAIEAALVQRADGGVPILSPLELANLPADGRPAIVSAPVESIILPSGPGSRPSLRASDDLSIALDLPIALPAVNKAAGMRYRLTGSWKTANGERQFAVTTATYERPEAFAPTRVVMFLTDGEVGNDQDIIQAVRDNAKTTRVFSFGIGNSVNRYLLDQMAIAGRGSAEFVQLASDGDAAVDRFTRRIQSPVLTDIEVSFSDGLKVTDLVAGNSGLPGGLIPDLFDQSPLVLHGRFAEARTGMITIRGRTGSGPWERTLALNPAAADPKNDMLPTLWARASVDATLAPYLASLNEQGAPADVRAKVVALGVEHHILSPFTSFVAVEKGRVTINGQPMLVNIPVELPEGTRFDGFFGGESWKNASQQLAGREVRLGLPLKRSGDDKFGTVDSYVTIGFSYGTGSSDPDAPDAQSGSPAASLSSDERQKKVNELLLSVRSHQIAMHYQEALDDVDRILAIDPLNPSAGLLRDAIRTTAEYQQAIDEGRKGMDGSTRPLEAGLAFLAPSASDEHIAGGSYDIKAVITASTTGGTQDGAVASSNGVTLKIENKSATYLSAAFGDDVNGDEPGLKLDASFDSASDDVLFGVNGRSTSGVVNAGVPQLAEPCGSDTNGGSNVIPNLPAMPNLGGPGARSVTGLTQYPPDWSEISVYYNTNNSTFNAAQEADPNFQLKDFFNQSGDVGGTLKDPVVFGGAAKEKEARPGARGNPRGVQAGVPILSTPPAVESSSSGPGAAGGADAAGAFAPQDAAKLGEQSGRFLAKEVATEAKAPGGKATPVPGAAGEAGAPPKPAAMPAPGAPAAAAAEGERVEMIRRAIESAKSDESAKSEMADRSVMSSGQKSSEGIERARKIEQLKDRHDELAAEGRKAEAEQIVDQMLFLDPANKELQDLKKAPEAEFRKESMEGVATNQRVDAERIGGAPRSAVRGGGGGGSLFGLNDKKSDESSAPGVISDEERREAFVSILTESVHSDVWADNGGELLTIDSEDPTLTVVQLQGSPEAAIAAADAESFISSYLSIFFPTASTLSSAPASASGLVIAPDVAALYDGLESAVVDPFGPMSAGRAFVHLAESTGLPLKLDRQFTESHSFDSMVELETPTVAADAIEQWMEVIEEGSSTFFDVSPDAVLVRDEYRAESGPLPRPLAVYDVRDLMMVEGMDSDECAQRLIDVVQENVASDSWYDNGGGTASIQEFDGRFFIKAPEFIHRSVQVLLAQLRNALGLPFSETFRRAVAWRQSWSIDTPRHTRFTIVYNIGRLLGTNENRNAEDELDVDDQVQSLLDVLTESVDPDGWKDNGGDTSSVQFFNNCLIIGTTFEIHGMIHDVLSRQAGAVGGAIDFLHPTPAVLMAEAVEAPIPDLADVLDDVDVQQWLSQHGLVMNGQSLVMLPEHAVLLAKQLLADASPGRAKAIDRALIDAAPAHDLAAALHSLLLDHSLASVERAAQVDQIAVAAQARLDRAAELQKQKELIRAQLDHLRKTLDDRLLALAMTQGAGADQKAASAGLDAAESGVLVTVAAADTADSTLSALRKAGLDIKDVSKPARLVVGRIPAANLVAAAQVLGVKRIEPTSMKPMQN